MRSLARPVVVALALAAGGCGPAGEGGPELLVFAAASLADAGTEIGAAFEQEAGVAVRFNFGSSSSLVRQHLLGAPADLLLLAAHPAGTRLERSIAEGGGTVRVFATGELVVVAPASSRLELRELADLSDAQRVAVGDPAAQVPVGLLARSWLQREGAWDALAGRLLPMPDARATLAAVSAGEADAALVYRSDAASTESVRIVLAGPGAGERIEYRASRAAGAPAAAADLQEFLRSPRARSILRRHGFGVDAPVPREASR
jgi:molybdate transport system substrate-binding protein